MRNALEAAGIRCWIAPDHIEGGQSYAKQIPNAIRNAKVFVVLISGIAMESQWVSKELDSAINEGKRIMPFVLDDTPLTDEFRFYLSNVQQYRAYSDFDGSMQRLIEDIRIFIGPKTEPAPEPQPKTVPAPEPKPEPEPKPQSKPQPKPEPKPKKTKRFPLIPVIVGGIVLVAIAVGVIIAASGKKNMSTGTTSQTSSAESAATTQPEAGSPLSAFIQNTSFTAADHTFTKEELSEFAKLDGIEFIHVTNCTFEGSDLSALAGPNVLTLDLSGCGLNAEQIGSLPLAGSKIRTLDLHDNPIGADAVITLPETLDALDISDTGMSAECVRGLSLDELHMDGNGLTSLDALSGMKNLRILFVSRNALESLDDLEKCINLRTLVASENEIASIAGLTNATRLEIVDLSDNGFTDVSVLLKSAETLKKVDLSGNTLDVSAIKDVTFPNLTDIYMNDCGLKDTAFLSAMPALKFVYLNDNPLLKALPKDVHAVRLSMENCGIDGYAGGYVPNEKETYVKLFLRGNKSTGIYLSPNFNQDYRYSVLDLADLTPDANTGAMLKNVKGNIIAIGYSEYLDIKALKDNWYTVYLVGCPLDKELDVEDVLGSRVKFYDTSADLPDTLN